MKKFSTVFLLVGGTILLAWTRTAAVAQEAPPFPSLIVPASWNLPTSISYTEDSCGQINPEYAARKHLDPSLFKNVFTYAADRNKWRYEMYRAQDGSPSLDVVHWYNGSRYGRFQSCDDVVEVSTRPGYPYDYAQAFNRLLAPFQFLVRTPQGKYEGFSAPSYATVCDVEQWKAFFMEATLVKTDGIDKEQVAIYKSNVFAADKQGDRCYYLVTFAKNRVGAPVRVEKFLENGDRVCDVSVESFQENGGDGNTPSFSFPRRVRIDNYDGHNVLRGTNIAILKKLTVGEKISPEVFEIDYSLSKFITDYDKTIFKVPRSG